MRVLETTLLAGPYDWDPSLLPYEEYAARLEPVRATVAAAGAGALLLYGHAGDHGVLSYLTGFVPKLDSAIGLVPIEGPVRLLVSGTPLMIPWAKRLTWVEDVRPLANLGTLVSAFLSGPAVLATWGAEAMPYGMYKNLAAASGVQRLLPLDATLDALRRCKTPRARHLVERACRGLAAAAAAFVAAAKEGKGNRSAALAAERAAIAAGAQDVRVLTSLHPGGPPLPIDSAADRMMDPLLAAIAVRFTGYWAEGVVTVARSPCQAQGRADAALSAVLGAAQPGARGDHLWRIAAEALAPAAPHRMMEGVVGNATGLSLDEGALAADATLERGGVYALRIAATDGAAVALASAMVAVEADRVTVLWSSLSA